MDRQETATLKQIYREVKEDIQSMDEEIKWIHTTEDFFKWRDAIKKANREDSARRNEVVEATIRGNKTLELLYDWTKFYRIMDSSKARLFSLKDELRQSDVYPKEKIDTLSFSSTCPLYNYLSRYANIDINGLFEMIKIGNFGFRYNEFPPFHTLYEFLKMTTHEETYGPFAIDILVCLLRACGISGEDLITCGRKVEEEAKRMVQDFPLETSLKGNAKIYLKP